MRNHFPATTCSEADRPEGRLPDSFSQPPLCVVRLEEAGVASVGEAWQVGVLRIELEEDVPVLGARGGLVWVGGAEFREQLAAAVDADLLEEGLQVVLHGVRRDEESFGDRSRSLPEG
jgi:hypothetical protein